MIDVLEGPHIELQVILVMENKIKIFCRVTLCHKQNFTYLSLTTECISILESFTYNLIL